VEIEIGSSLLRLALVIKLRSWLEDSNGNFPVVNWTFLLSDTEDFRAGRPAIGNCIFGRILAELFYRHLVCMKSPGIEGIVVCNVDGVIPRDKLGWNAVVKRDGWDAKLR
jgi:hypothetical protein